MKSHGPLTDSQLAWWLKHFGVAESTAKAARRRLTDAGHIRFARMGLSNGNGQLAKLWEFIK